MFIQCLYHQLLVLTSFNVDLLWHSHEHVVISPTKTKQSLWGGDLSTLKVQSADDIRILHETLLKEGPKEHLEGYQDQARPLGWLWQAFLDPDSLTEKLVAQNSSCRSNQLEGPSFTLALNISKHISHEVMLCNCTPSQGNDTNMVQTEELERILHDGM